MSLLADDKKTTPWTLAGARIANREEGQANWLATVRPDGQAAPHARHRGLVRRCVYFLAGEGTRKAKNLAADGRCVIGTGSYKLPSIDIAVEGHAEPLDEPDAVRDMTEVFKKNGWPLEARGVEVFGPNAPTAGPPPYRIFRMVPSAAFGLPGQYGMGQDSPRTTCRDRRAGRSATTDGPAPRRRRSSVADAIYVRFDARLLTFVSEQLRRCTRLLVGSKAISTTNTFGVRDVPIPPRTGSLTHSDGRPGRMQRQPGRAVRVTVGAVGQSVGRTDRYAGAEPHPATGPCHAGTNRYPAAGDAKADEASGDRHPATTHPATHGAGLHRRRAGPPRRRATRDEGLPAPTRQG